MSTRSLIALAVLGLWSFNTVQYARVWQNELTLWSYTAPRSPLKPRPWLQLSLALLEQRRYREAQDVLDYVDAMLKANPDVPIWDRVDAARAVTHDRLVLARLAASSPWSH